MILPYFNFIMAWHLNIRIKKNIYIKNVNSVLESVITRIVGCVFVAGFRVQGDYIALLYTEAILSSYTH